MTLTPKLFWAVIAVYMAVRLGLAFMSYRGDDSIEARERALVHFDRASIDAGVEYRRAAFPPAVVMVIFELAVLLWMTLGGASLRLARFSLDLSGGRVWLQTLVYLAIFMAGLGLASLPFEYWQHGVERRFGFTTMTPGQWLAYEIKQAAVGGGIALAIGFLGYALVRQFPRGWAWMIPAAALVLQLAMIVVFPRLLLPLFYKIEPPKDLALVAELRAVAHKAGVEVTNIRVINASRYSSHTNAFFTGFGKFKEIYLYDTLLKDHSPAEVGAILAHELGHWKKNHVLKGAFLAVAGLMLACLALLHGFPHLARAPFMNTGPLADVSSLPALLLLASIVSYFTRPIESAVSRRFEREADAFGLALANAPETFVRDFKQLAASNKSDLLPHPATVFWSYSHPPLVERIETIEHLAAHNRAEQAVPPPIAPADGAPASQ